ncbi:PREDICTED: proton pump-interactor 2 isoform X2 [Tarenaya hassleriana]|nr:PREDICTED: proton pump-interactor 2 isoform X2 [Tarenaya hassleriana]XP_010535086.1 PREDICTED: proton pump-interactor 2 isoform X2 [Tarenaya hassleriana]
MVSRIILCDGFEVVSPPELNELLLFENDQSGSNADESTVTTEDYDAVFSGDSPPSDAAEEWPLPKVIRSFYVVKQHPCNNPLIRAKLDEADKEIYQCNVARIQISDALKAKRAERSALLAQMECLNSELDGYDAMFDEKKREMESLREGLGKLRGEKELDDLMNSINYGIEYENNTPTEEKQILKKIKQPEWEMQIQDPQGQNGGIINRIKSMAMNMDEVKKDQQAVTAKINRLSEKLQRIKMETESLDAELAGVLDKRDKAFERIKMLRRQRDLRNATFLQSRFIMMRAGELAAAGNVKGLKELANAEVEKFMSLWNTDKAFRDDYKERVSASLDERHLNQDGRIKNLEQDLLVALESLRPLDIRTDGVEKVHEKWGTEDSRSCSSQVGNIATEQTKKEEKMVTDSNKSGSEESDCMDFDILSYQMPQMEEKMDEETLKEKKREEQLEKARQAMERKRKLQEKTAAKAAIRAQKEAEKKNKDREKKAKKKAAANSCPLQRGEIPESVTEASEPEKVESSALVKKRSLLPKQRSFRYRHRGRGTEALPKAILKRRKAYKFWVWTVSSVAFSLALFIFAFCYVR